MDHCRREELAGAAAADLAGEDEPPQHGADGEPEPQAQPRQAIGDGGQHREIEHHRPGIGIVAVDQQRRDEGADQAEPGERGTMQGGGEHAGDADHAQGDEGGGRADEAIERMGGIDRAEGGHGAGGRQHGRDAGLGEIGNRRFRRRLAPAQHFAGDDQRSSEDEPESHPGGGSEQPGFDGIAHQQQGAERQSEAADPHGPARAETFLQAAGRPGTGRRGGSSFDRRGRRRSSLGQGLDRLGDISCSRRSGGRRGRFGWRRRHRLGRSRVRVSLGGGLLEAAQPVFEPANGLFEVADAAARPQRQEKGDRT